MGHSIPKNNNKWMITLIVITPRNFQTANVPRSLLGFESKSFFNG